MISPDSSKKGRTSRYRQRCGTARVIGCRANSLWMTSQEEPVHDRRFAGRILQGQDERGFDFDSSEYFLKSVSKKDTV